MPVLNLSPDPKPFILLQPGKDRIACWMSSKTRIRVPRSPARAGNMRCRPPNGPRQADVPNDRELCWNQLGARAGGVAISAGSWPCWRASGSVAPHGRPAAGSSPSRADRSFGCDPGSVSGGRGPAGRVSAQPFDAVLLVAPIPYRPEAGDLAPASSRCPDARREPASLARSRSLPRGVFRSVGRPVPGSARPPPATRRSAPRCGSEQEAIDDGMAPLDREVLALRHFEQSAALEIAQELEHFRGRRRQNGVFGLSNGSNWSWTALLGDWKGSGHEHDHRISRDRSRRRFGRRIPGAVPAG